MIVDENKSIWQEKYRPQCIDDMILPENIKQKFKRYVEKDLPNIGLWSANPGLGKSSLANAIIRELKYPAKFINASLEKGIDVLRTDIQSFAKSSSMDSDYKIVVMDESDNISKDFQSAFRGFLDEFSENCRFIFTGNYKEKIIEPLLDRLENYDFSLFNKKEMVKPIFERLCFILEHENIKYDKKQLVPVINAFYPGIRSMINTLQQCSSTGEFILDEKSIDSVNVFDNLMKLVKPESYYDMISEVNNVNSPDAMYNYLYHNAEKYFKPESYPNVIIILAKYQDMAVSAINKNLTLAGCLTELMKFNKA